ncbi:MAG TPA: hypothetical protein VM010_05135, partial [Chitinophagaceae bacterium]|nr:hypothetical protein [Chitinophagaceae bacterium]
MEIQLSEGERRVLAKIAEAAQQLQFPCYLIGGFVRDKRLGRPTKDADIVCVGDGLLLAERAAALFSPKPVVSYFKTFGTAQFTLADGFQVEFVGARKESYLPHTRNPEVMPGTITDDQNRRDFTINALAISLNAADFGTLVDPFGGLHDLEQKIIKTPLAPDITFSDDPLRMLRAIRFAAQLGFEISWPTLDAIKRNATRISIISQERITDELNKILLSAKPSVGF